MLVAGLVAGCSRPPPPSAETAALESALLTVADIGGGLVEEHRGAVSASGGGVCPESGFSFEDVGLVAASFVWPTDGEDAVGLTEMVRTGDQAELEALFAELTAAYEACYGLVWTDYGDTQTVEPMAVPDVGDDRLGVHALHGEPPFEGRHDDVRLVYVRAGNTYAEISIAETLDHSGDLKTVSDAEFSRIVAEAIARLPG